MSILAEKQDNIPQSVPVQGHQARFGGFSAASVPFQGHLAHPHFYQGCISPENRPNSTKKCDFGRFSRRDFCGFEKSDYLCGRFRYNDALIF